MLFSKIGFIPTDTLCSSIREECASIFRSLLNLPAPIPPRSSQATLRKKLTPALPICWETRSWQSPEILTTRTSRASSRPSAKSRPTASWERRTMLTKSGLCTAVVLPTSIPRPITRRSARFATAAKYSTVSWADIFQSCALSIRSRKATGPR